MVCDQRNTAKFGYQRTISHNKIGKILSQMNHLAKTVLGESLGVEIQASALTRVFDALWAAGEGQPDK